MTAATVYHVMKELHALASKIYVLATGLQNAAPPGTSGKSIQYLIEASAELQRFSTSLQQMLPEGGQEPRLGGGRQP